MMTLGELKRLHQDIEKRSKEIKKSMKEQFRSRDMTSLPKSALITHDYIKGLMINLELLNDKIAMFIHTSESTIEDNDVLDWTYYPDPLYSSQDEKMAEIICSYELLKQEYTKLNLYLKQAERTITFGNELVFDDGKNRYVNLLPGDFSDKFIDSIYSKINPVLSIMSGEFDVERINSTLSNELNLYTIDPKYYLHENFAKDGSCAYFDHQSVLTRGRETPVSIQNKKIDDFIDYYLERTGSPTSIKPNLKALLTTLCCQGSLGYLPPFLTQKFFSLHGNSILDSGQSYSLRFSLGEGNQIKIQLLVDQNAWMTEVGFLENIKSIIKIECTIAVELIDKKVPYFSLRNATVNCSFGMPAEHPMTIEKSAFKNPHRVSLNNLNPLPAFMHHLVKYLEYNSLEDFFIKQGKALNTSLQRDSLEVLDLFGFYGMVRDSSGRQFSDEESNFLNTMMDDYKQQNLSIERMNLQICQFVNGQLNNPDLSNADKLRYVYWLQLARDLKGFEDFNDEIHKIYITLVKQFVNEDPSLLIERAKDDKELYQEIVSPDSIFTKKLNLTDEDHAFILGKYPSLLQGKRGASFENILYNLNSQAKFLFLSEFSKNGGDMIHLDATRFFGQDLKLLSYFVERAPAAQVAYLRQGPLEKLFSNYLDSIQKNLTPADLLYFLNELREQSDGKLISRFGLEFVVKLVDKVSELARSENLENVSMVSPIVLELKKLLSTESAESARDVMGYLSNTLNSAGREAKKSLSEKMRAEGPTEKSVKEKTKDAQVELLIEESEKGKMHLDEAESRLKSMKKIKEPEEKLEIPKKK